MAPRVVAARRRASGRTMRMRASTQPTMWRSSKAVTMCRPSTHCGVAQYGLCLRRCPSRRPLSASLSAFAPFLTPHASSTARRAMHCAWRGRARVEGRARGHHLAYSSADRVAQAARGHRGSRIDAVLPLLREERTTQGSAEARLAVEGARGVHVYVGDVASHQRPLIRQRHPRVLEAY